MDGDDEEEADIRREEKGKMPVHHIEREFAVKARLSDSRIPDVVMKFSKGENVRTIARRVAEEAGVGYPPTF